MDIKQRTLEIVQEYLPDDHFVVDISFKPAYKTQKLSIILDGDQGVSIDTCSMISRKVGYFLEQENAIAEAYQLEVSSPGLDAPFTNLRQYKKNIGREVKIVLPEKVVKKGILEEVMDDETILFHEVLTPADKGRKAKMASEKQIIKTKDIVKINVVLTF
jgi:ribosome maturation factor RimP